MFHAERSHTVKIEGKHKQFSSTDMVTKHTTNHAKAETTLSITLPSNVPVKIGKCCVIFIIFSPLHPSISKILFTLTNEKEKKN